MEYKNLYLKGINEIVEKEDYTQFYRFPNDLKQHLESAGFANENLHGCEIRFIYEEEVLLTLKSLINKSHVVIYFGDFQLGVYEVNTEPTTIKIKNPFRKEEITNLNKQKLGFLPNLVRIKLFRKITLVDILGKYSLPKASDMPKNNIIAYGTSITEGYYSHYADITYPQLVAQAINYDLENLAMNGTCFIEKAYVDYLLTKNADLYILSISINMLEQNYELNVFKERVKYLLKKINEINPYAKVITISIYPSYREFRLVENALYDTSGSNKFREILENESKKYENVAFLKGEEVLSFKNLTTDLLHPGHYGMFEIAHNIINKLKKYD